MSRGHKGKPRPIFERLLDKIEVDGDCWVWAGSRNPAGYGQLRVEGQTLYAHRLMYEHMLDTEIPSGLSLDHLCRNHPCVNPDHLEPVTQRENLLRGFGATGKRARQTHCQGGHPFNKENTYVVPATGHRKCRACRRVGAAA